jgi:exodeoxyribonuclease V alpha subunit
MGIANSIGSAIRNQNITDSGIPRRVTLKGSWYYGFGELDTLVPAYAATIHKSQGSEYPAVIIPVLTQHYAMLQRNLLYTGVTRGKRLVVLVGQKKAIAIAVRNVSGRRRWSKLDERLRLGAPSRPSNSSKAD